MTEINYQSYEDLSTELKNLKEFEQQLVDSEKKYRFPLLWYVSNCS